MSLKTDFSKYLSSLRKGTIAVIFLLGNLFTKNHCIKISIFDQDKQILEFLCNKNLVIFQKDV